MHFNLVFLVAIAMVAASEWNLCEGYLSRAHVTVEDGKCQYNDTEISPSEPLRLEHPCEEWRCHPGTEGTGEVVLAGCSVVVPGPGCARVKGTGFYPDCCYKVVCD